MSGEDSNTGAPPGSAPADEETELSEEAVRERMREMTARALKSGRIDVEGVKEFGRAMGAGFETAGIGASAAKEAFSDAVTRLDLALMASAESAHAALSTLAAKGEGITDNDLKEALEQLKQLQKAYQEVSARVAQAASGNIQREFHELARHAQKLGTEASAEVASMISEFAGKLSSSSSETAQSGLDLTRQYGMRMAYMTSGVLAGIADALKDHSTSNKGE